MIVMPANSSGWFFHSLALRSGRIGHLYSPGAQRGPWPWFPHALDNGCFSLWDKDTNTFDEAAWLSTGEPAWRRLIFWAESKTIKPMWAIVPDRPGNWDETARKWNQYALDVPFPRAVAVQDGATPAAVRALSPAPHVIAVGGSKEWKWATAADWIREFPRVHVLRCNEIDKVAELEALGAQSCDGTGWQRGNRKKTAALEEWALSRGTALNVRTAHYVCREKVDKNQTEF